MQKVLSFEADQSNAGSSVFMADRRQALKQIAAISLLAVLPVGCSPSGRVLKLTSAESSSIGALMLLSKEDRGTFLAKILSDKGEAAAISDLLDNMSEASAEALIPTVEAMPSMERQTLEEILGFGLNLRSYFHSVEVPERVPLLRTNEQLEFTGAPYLVSGAEVSILNYLSVKYSTAEMALLGPVAGVEPDLLEGVLKFSRMASVESAEAHESTLGKLNSIEALALQHLFEMSDSDRALLENLAWELDQGAELSRKVDFISTANAR